MSRETNNQLTGKYEANDYSFMLQSIEKKLASSITAQVNDIYQRSAGKKQTTIPASNTDHTIELPSQIALHSTPATGAKTPFIDPSLSSIQLHPSILKKRRISNESSDESTFLYNPEDHTVEVAEHNPRLAAGAPLSRTITLQSQIDELKIINETQKEQIRLLKVELENTKETSIRQLSFLETQNKRYKQELEDKTNKYYEDKKKWQVKVKEIEERYQKKSLNTTSSQSTSASTVTNSNHDHCNQFISELQQQLQSVNALLSDKFTEMESLSQQKANFEKKAILLENEVKTLKMQLQFSSSSSSASYLSSSNNNNNENEMIPKQEYFRLQDKALEEKLSYQKQITILEKTIQQKMTEIEKMKESIRNQLLLEEQISQLTNEKLLFEEKKEEYLSMERKYYSLIEEKKHLHLIFMKIQQLLQPNQTSNDLKEASAATATTSIMKEDDVTSGMISHVKILTLIQGLQEKYLLLLNDYHLLQSKQGLLQESLDQRGRDYQELLRQHQTLQTELQKKEVQSSHSRHQIQSFEREIRSLRDLLQTYDFEFSVSQGKKKGGTAGMTTASNTIEPVSEDTLMKLKNELIEKSQKELDELRGKYGELVQRLQELERQLQVIESEKQQLVVENQALKEKEMQSVESIATERKDKMEIANPPETADPKDDNDAVVQEWKAKYEELMNNYQGLQEVSGVDYLPSKTKILRLIDNPSMLNRPDLSSSAQLRSSTFPPELLQRLQTENIQLRHQLKETNNMTTTSSSSTTQALNLSDENIPVPTTISTTSSTTGNNAVVDPTKLNQRLKEIFREKINTLRNGIYLLTGYQVELSSTETLPRFKLKSMYAENVDDYLIFQMDGDNLQLLESKYALSLDPSLTSYLTKYQSFPAFLSNLTLHLFENQTFMA